MIVSGPSIARIVGRFIGAAMLHGTAVGCAAPAARPQWVYYPGPPDPPRAVHLLSFNELSAVVRPAATWIDTLRGGRPGPWVGTPLDLAVRDRTLYIADSATNCVHVWHLDEARGAVLGADVLRKPVAVAVDADARAYVADAVRHEVLVFDRDGILVQRLGREQAGLRPVAVAVAGKDLFVADVAHHRIEVYDTATGQWLRSFGGAGSGPGQLSYPSGVAIGPAERVYVADMMNARVQVFGRDGRFVKSLGGRADRGGHLAQPKDLAVAADGTVFVADAGYQCVTLLDDHNRLLLRLGGPGDQPGSTPLPNGLAISTVLPAAVLGRVPAGFQTAAVLWISNTTGPLRLSVVALGEGPAQPAAGGR